MKPVVIDTNVAVVANRHADHISDLGCVEKCIEVLAEIVSSGRVCIDDCNIILGEYRKHLSPSGQPGTGDLFFKWLWNNQGNVGRVQQVRITPKEDNSDDFEEFPVDDSLKDFHRKDRKFVAVALASGLNPCILNASDTGWWKYRNVLKEHGCLVKFLCPQLMAGGAYITVKCI